MPLFQSLISFDCAHKNLKSSPTMSHYVVRFPCYGGFLFTAEIPIDHDDPFSDEPTMALADSLTNDFNALSEQCRAHVEGCNGRLITLLHRAPQISHALIQTIGLKLLSLHFRLYGSVIDEAAHGCPHHYYPGSDCISSEVARGNPRGYSDDSDD